MGHRVGNTFDWFRDGISLKVSSGLFTSFWEDTWFRDSPLSLRFPRLFSISDQSSSSVREVVDERGRFGYGTLNGGDIFFSIMSWPFSLISNL